MATTDTAAAALFYEALFGWRTEPGTDAGGPAVFALDATGPQVAGVGPVRMPQQPAAWLPYFQSSGVDAVTARVGGNGGRVVSGPSGVGDRGRLAVCQDPAGAAFGLWEPLEHAGFQTVNVPGSFTWFELLTRDPGGAVDFYQSVLGWGTRRHDGCLDWTVADEPFGGMVDMSAGDVPQGPSQWNLYVAVTDPDATAARCTEAGGQTVVEPRDTPAGRFALLTDPQGAAFSVLRAAS
nr:VOC family protein [Streptomyces sp. SID5785]